MKKGIILYLIIILIIFQLYFIMININHIYHNHEHCITCSLICQWKDKINYNPPMIIIIIFTTLHFMNKNTIQMNLLEQHRTLIALKVELNN